MFVVVPFTKMIRCNMQGLGLIQPSSAHGWLGSQSSASGLIVKKTIRVDIPIDKYPTVSYCFLPKFELYYNPNPHHNSS